TEVGKKHGLYTFFGQMPRYATYGDNVSTYEYRDTTRYESYDYTKNKIGFVDPFPFGNNYRNFTFPNVSTGDYAYKEKFDGFPLVNPKGNPFESYFTPTNPSEKVLNNQFGYGGTLSFKSNNFVFTPNDFGVTDSRLKGINNTHVLRNWQISSILHNIVYLNQGDLIDTTEINRTFYALLTRTDNTVDTIKVTVKLLPTDDLGDFYFGFGNQTAQFVPSGSTIRNDDIPSNAKGFYDTFSGYSDTKNPDPVLQPINKYFSFIDYDYNTDIDVELRYEFPNLPTVKTVQNDTIFLENSMFKLKISNKISNITATSSSTNLQFPFNISFKSIDKFSPVDIGAGLLRFVFKDKRTGRFRGYIAYNFDPQFVIDDIIFTGVSNFPNINNNISYFPTSPLFNVTNADFVDGDQTIKGFKSVSLKVDGLQYFLDEYIKSSISGDLILLKNANTNGTLFNGTVTYVVTPNNNKTSSTITFTFPAGYSNTQLKDFINSFQFVTKFGNLDKWTDGQKTITITSIQKYATTNFEITNPLVANLNVIGNADKYFENDITKFNIFNSTHSPIGSSVFNNSFDFSSAILTFSPLLNGGSSALIQSDDRYEFIANNVSINGNNISVNNTIIGTYSIANNVVTCTLNSNANPSLVDELIKSFTYSNISQDPALKAIQIDWRLSKLSNEITGSNFFFCIPINDPPTFSFESVTSKEFLPGQQLGQNGSVIEYSKIKLFEKLNSSNNLVNVPVSISTIEANQNITQIKFKVTASDSWISVNSYVEEYLIINNNAHRLNSSTFVENGLNFAFSVSGNVVTCTIDNPLNKSIQEITDLLSNMYYTTNAASTNINLNPTRLFEFTSITDNGFNEINSTNSVFNKNFSDLIYNDTQNRLKITFKSNAVINAIPYTYLSTPANLTSLGDYPTNRLKLDLWTSYKESAGYNETTQYIKKFKLKVSNVYPSSSQETGTEKIQISSTLLDLGINSSGTINNIPYVLTYDNSSKESIITFGADNSNFGNAIGSDQTTLSTFLSSIKYFNIDETPATNIRSFTLYNFIDNLDAVSTQEVKLFVSPVAPPALPFSISWKQNYNFSNDEGGENIVKLVLNGTIPASAYDYDNNGTPSYLLALAFTINDGRTTISSTSPYFRNITFSSGPSSPYLVIPNSLALNNLEIDLKISSIDDAVINNSQYYSYGLNVKEMASANYLGTVSSTPNYFLLTYSDPTFTIRDNDIPIMTITPTSKTVYEGQLNQSINVKLNLFPQKNPTNEITKVFVERVKLDGSIETDNTEINNFPTFFYFTNKRAGEGYETVITKDVNFDALLDATADGDQVVRLKFTVEKTYSVTCNGSLPCTIDYNNPSSYTIGSGSTTPFTNLTSTALINVKDVDIPLIFSENNLISQDIPEGTTKNFKIYLNDIPKNITITNNNSSLFEITQTNLAFSGTGLINGIVLSVKAIENSNYGNFTGTITLSDPTNFYAQPLILNVTGIDNDAKVVISPTTFPTSLTWTGNSTVTFSVALASLPTNNVNVNLSVPAYTIPNPPGSGNPSESKMYPIKLGTNQNLVLNFTPQNGTTPQTVTASVFLMGQNGNLLNSSASIFNAVIGNFTSQSINISTSTSADPVYAALSNTTYPYSIAKSTTSTGGGTSSGTSGATTTTQFFNSWKCILQNGEDGSNGTVNLLPAGGPPAGSGATYSLIYTLSDGSTKTYTVTDSRPSSTIPLSFSIPNSFLQSLTAASYPNGVKFEFKATFSGNSLSFGGSS
ncbi:MAG: hypothetical protein RLZZ546_3386, partial [Bacteroidota bacterium]